MRAHDFGEVIEDFLRCKLEPFTAEEFRKYLKLNKLKISLDEALDVLYSADCVFGLVNNFFITRAGAFTNQLFSFKPTKEEVEQGGFIPGDRFMPFVDPSLYPYNATLVFKKKKVPQTEVELNTNTALDLHALFGEGYIIPFILSDPAGDNRKLSTVQYGLPQNVMLTGYSLEPFFEEGFKMGDRLLCKVIDWDNMIIEVEIQQGSRGSMKMSQDDMKREEWYSTFEDAFIKKFEKCGPTYSIEEQLAFLFLEEQRNLCVEICGSCSDFLEHTSKIDFEPYGIESRIWKTGEEIPFIGNWNLDLANQRPLPDLSVVFADYVIDSFIKDNLYKTQLKGDTEKIFESIFPKNVILTDFERQFAMLHLEKRIDIVKKSYSRFVDYPLVSLRKKVLSLFSRITTLMWAIGDSKNKLEDFPQQELITISQLLGHVAHSLEEIELEPAHAVEEEEDLLTSLDGMIDTFDMAEILIQDALRKKKNIIKVIE